MKFLASYRHHSAKQLVEAESLVKAIPLAIVEGYILESLEDVETHMIVWTATPPYIDKETGQLKFLEVDLTKIDLDKDGRPPQRRVRPHQELADEMIIMRSLAQDYTDDELDMAILIFSHERRMRNNG